jgi:preprotein translocase subunit SecG
MILALTILFFIVAVLLMAVVLLQPGGSGGIGFIGGGSESAFGTKTGNVMTKITTTLAALFLVVSFVLGYLNSREGRVETEEIRELEETLGETGEPETGEFTGEDIGVDVTDTNE